LRVPLTVKEKNILRARAAAEQRSLAELARLALPLEEPPTPITNSNPLPAPDQVVMHAA
jgi:hypothetical protein